MLKLMKKKERANKTEMKITKYTFLSFYLFYRNIQHRRKQLVMNSENLKLVKHSAK